MEIPNCYYCDKPIGCVNDCLINSSFENRLECDFCIQKPNVIPIFIEKLYWFHTLCVANPKYYDPENHK